MDKQETMTLMQVISGNYSASLLPPLWQSNPSAAADSWQVMLSDVPYKSAQAVTLKLMMTEQYPPTVAQIRQELTRYQMEADESGKITAAEAWQKLLYATSHYGMAWKDKAEAYLGPDLWQQVAGEWRYYCIEMDEQAKRYEKARFLRAYEANRNKQFERAAIPEALNRQLEGIGQDMNKLRPISAAERQRLQAENVMGVLAEITAAQDEQEAE